MNDSERDNFQRCPGNSPCCLGIIEFDCCGTNKQKPDENALEFQQSKKARTSAKGKVPLSPSSRFNKTATESEISKPSKGVVPPSTTRSTNRAQRVLQEWVMQRNKRNKEKFPVDLFDKPYSVEVICNCLQRWKLEEDILQKPSISCLADADA